MSRVGGGTVRACLTCVFGVVTFLILVAWCIPGRALAYTGTATSLSDIPPSVPQSVAQSIVAQCNASYHVVQQEWLSSQTNSASQDEVVPYGATSVPMQLNYVTYRCQYQADATVEGHFKIFGTTPSIAAINGVVGSLPYVDPTISGAQVGVVSQFDYPAPGGTPFTSTGTVQMNMATRGTTTKQSGLFYCAKVSLLEPDVLISSATDFQPNAAFCATETDTFDFHITIAPPEPIVQGIKLTTGGLSQALPSGTNASPAFPFSDDQIMAVRSDGFSQSVTANGFNFRNCSAGCTDGSYDNRLLPGNYSFSSNDAGTVDTGWQYDGYTLCDASLSSCTDAYLNDPINIQSPTSQQVIADGVTYSMHFIYGLKFNACASSSLTAPGAENGLAFSTTVAIDFSSQPSTLWPGTGNSLTMAVTGPLNATYTYPGYTMANGNFLSATLANVNLPFGTYNAVVTLAGSSVPGGTISCPQTFTVARHPYFKVFGGDVSVGGSFKNAGSCAPPPAGAGKLLGSYNQTTSGAGVQLAAIAVLQVDGVATAALRPSPASPALPSGLTFANDPASPNYLGGFSNFTTGGALGYCAPDYFDELQYTGTSSAKLQQVSANPGHVINAYSPVDVPDGGQAMYTVKGHAMARLEAKKTPLITMFDKRSTVFVDGDVFLDDPIIYSKTWASVDSIPYLTVVVRGNIYIDSNVPEIDGVFIAQPTYDAAGVMTPKTGFIYTCRHSGTGKAISMTGAAGAVTSCATPLIVRGALIAQHLVLERTAGGLVSATTSELPGSPNIAEVINFTPEFYLGTPAVPSTSVKPDVLLNLPPTL